MHPLIKDIVQTNISFSTLYRKHLALDPVVIGSIIKIHDSFHGKENQETIYREVINLDLNHLNIHLRIYYLNQQTALLIDLGKTEQALTTYNHLKLLISKDTPEVLIYQSQITLLKINYKLNNLIDYAKTNIFKLLNSSKRFDGFTNAIIGIFASLGTLKDLDKNLLKVPSKTRMDSHLFSNYVEIGKTEEAIAQLSKIDSNKLQKLDVPVFKTSKLLLDLLTGNSILIENEDELNDETINALNINHFIYNNDIASAFTWKNKASRLSSKDLQGSFLSYTSIRLALIQKNIDAARTLLLIKTEDIKHYFDDLYFARISLLLNEKEKALIYFSRLLKNCEKYDSINLLDFELNLAKEMQPGDIRYLSQMSKSVSNKRLHLIKEDTNYDLTQENFGAKRIIGQSLAIKKLIKEIKQYAQTPLPILIRGETGVGKDLIAHVIHQESPQKDEPYLAINCGAISDTILQSELFGHVAGAYTSAVKDHKGIFEAAGKGTVFLDEIGETSPKIQVALLRVLENMEGRAVGANKPIKYHCRILAATNSPLEDLIIQGSFREDLYFRLKRLEVHVPSLRERKEDIEILSKYFFNLNQLNNRQPFLTKELINHLTAYSWPGNIRELKNEIEKARILNLEKDVFDTNDIRLPLANTNKRLRHSEPRSPQLPLATSENLMLIKNNRSSIRRRQLIRELFQQHQQLSRLEINNTIDASYRTIGTDLKELVEEDFIEKVEPTSSPRTHYFILKT